MDKREKVMKGLECCSIGLYCPDEECPYEKDKEEKQENCIALLARDALEVLKAQEPRLLTEREIMDAKNIDVYLEETTDAKTHPLRLVGTETESRNKAAFFWPSIVRPLDTYGVAWRCWTAEPTVDQRVLVPWE